MKLDFDMIQFSKRDEVLDIIKILEDWKKVYPDARQMYQANVMLDLLEEMAFKWKEGSDDF
jgi:hypothetical protein